MSLPSSQPLDLPANPRILVVSLRRIGDVLLSTPLIRSLRRDLPEARIEALVFAGTEGIITGNPDIDNVVTMPERPSARETLALLARLWRRYDLAIATQTGDRPTFFTFVAGRRRAGLIPPQASLGSALKRTALQRTVVDEANTHRVELMLRIADALGIARVPETVAPAGGNADAAGGRYAVIHATPMFKYKQWTQAGWRALAAALRKRGLSVIAVGGPGADERRILDTLCGELATVRQLPWAQTAALIAKARVYVGADTAATHLAAATGCPTVALFGPTDPRVWGPWPTGGLDRPWQASGSIQRRGNVWIVQNPLPCLPCTFEGCERHIESASICLEELTAAAVLRAVDQALA